jgi:ketosteroid isomerase-like protein
VNYNFLLTLIFIWATNFSPKAWAGMSGEACMGSLLNSSAALNEFSQTATKFLTSVKERDFNTFKKFFREDLEFTAILPGGKVINDVSTFMASQSSWFNGKTGSFDFSFQRTEMSGDLGSAHATVDYKNVDAGGKPFELEIYITFLFRKVDGSWFLVHDQNSVLREVR